MIFMGINDILICLKSVGGRRKLTKYSDSHF